MNDLASAFGDVDMVEIGRTNDQPPEVSQTATVLSGVNATSPDFNDSVSAMRLSGSADLPSLTIAAWRDGEVDPPAEIAANPAGSPNISAVVNTGGFPETETFNPTCGGGMSVDLTCEIRLSKDVCLP